MAHFCSIVQPSVVGLLSIGMCKSRLLQFRILRSYAYLSTAAWSGSVPVVSMTPH